jgi:hypothetical protein
LRFEMIFVALNLDIPGFALDNPIKCASVFSVFSLGLKLDGFHSNLSTIQLPHRIIQDTIRNKYS